MRIIFYIILSLCAVQPCRAAEELVAQPAPVQCQPKSLLARDIVLYDKYQSVLKALAGMPESSDLTECIDEFRDLTLWAGKKNGKRPKNFVKRVKLLRNVIIESTEISDAVKDDALEALNGISKKRVGLSRGARWGIGLGSAVVAAALLGCLVIVCRRGQRRALVRAHKIALIQAMRGKDWGALMRFAAMSLDDEDSNRLLHFAAREGGRATVEILLNRGVDVNAVDQDGRTALFSAAKSNDSVVVELLISRRADIHVSDLKKWTVFGRVVSRGYRGLHPSIEGKTIGDQKVKIAKLLIAAGASVNARDREQRTPVYNAVRNNHVKMLELLFENDAMAEGNRHLLLIANGNKNPALVECVEAQITVEISHQARWSPERSVWIGLVVRGMNAAASNMLRRKWTGGGAPA
jgi:hypothetical protein